MNRIYYSMFYAVSALANAHGFNAAKHSSMEGWFNKTIVHTGLIDEEMGKIYRQVFDLRSKGDYDDTMQIDSTIVKKYLDAAGLFIEILRRLTLERLEEIESS